MKEGDSDLCLC